MCVTDWKQIRIDQLDFKQGESCIYEIKSQAYREGDVIQIDTIDNTNAKL